MELTSPHLDSAPDNHEHDLITQAKLGDRWAFGELVRHHRTGVTNLVYRICGDANLSEDAAQEAFIRAWRYLDKYQPKTNFRNWIYKIAMNSAYNLLRTEKQTVDIDNTMLAETKKGPEQSMVEQERSQRIQQAVLSLPEASRSVLVLREYEGLSYRDIAETLDVPMGTVMSRLNYARQILRTALADLLEAG